MWVKAQPLVTSFLYSTIRNTHDAEDLLQEVAAAALTDFDRFDVDRPFIAWVLGIARFRVLNYYRRRRSHEQLLFDDEALAVFAQAHEQLASQESARRHALDKCLQRLDGRMLTALRLRYAQDQSVQAIADSLSTTANAVSLLLHKARKSLADCIQRRVSQEGAT
jgi:RNA polymerase sigma-70 factor (ECF subfamily)